MSARNLLALCLSLVATLHLASGQTWWNNGWDQGGGWGSRGLRSNLLGRNRDEEADTAVCTDSLTETDANMGTVTLEATVKRRSNGWWSSGIELEIRVAADANFDDSMNVMLVFTQFGATDNNGGCTRDNLGEIITRRRNNRIWWSGSSMNSNGVIATFALNAGLDRTFTSNELPINSVRDAWGCGLALCREVRERTSGTDMDHGWGWGWLGHSGGWGGQRRSTFECGDAIQLCCHFGKFDGDAQISA